MPRYAIIAADHVTIRQSGECAPVDVDKQAVQAGEEIIILDVAQAWVTSRAAQFDPVNRTFVPRTP